MRKNRKRTGRKPNERKKRGERKKEGRRKEDDNETNVGSER